jgi:60 kDa SS-A/Ro ribonucleoprotein
MCDIKDGAAREFHATRIPLDGTVSTMLLKPPMTNYARHLVSTQTEQDRPGQVKNSAGGYSFKLSHWARLERFLILGNEGGTYYAAERKLTRENATCVEQCLREDGRRAVNTIVDISESGRAPKNDPAIFALALAASCPDQPTRAMALAAMPDVCRIGTHLFHFFSAVNEMRGWGRGMRRAFSKWYLDKPVDRLAHELLKYQQRDGVSHRDVLRMAHPKSGKTGGYGGLFRYVTGGAVAMGDRKMPKRLGENAFYPSGPLHPLFAAYEELKAATDYRRVVGLIEANNFTHEMIPSQWKNEPLIWAVLLKGMPITATIRNLAKMTAVGLLAPFSEASRLVASRITDQETIRKGRVHPIQFLSALKVYQQGHGERGALTWSPVQQIVDALDSGFYQAFQEIKPTGKNFYLGIDVSASMDGGAIAGVPGLTPRVSAAAMAMVQARTDPYLAVGFAAGRTHGERTGLVEIKISPRQRLDDVIRTMQQIPMGGTDCALPMLHAAHAKLPVDVFCVYTDNETWAGNIHPHKALSDYRQKMGRDAKLCVVGMTATDFTIADPDDAGTMDVVGFDTAAPAVISDFVRS